MKIPGFKIERLLAEGGMASVYLAVQESLERRIALKVLREFDNAEQSRRFLHEGRIIASLNHRNIITIHDIGRVDRTHYIAMEYMEGGSLTGRIAQGMKMLEILSLLEAISRCLTVVHGKGIIHRDIKPGNILFHADQTPKLTDFGIAKELHHDRKLTVADGLVIGTPSYISTEQARGKPPDERSDIYSLGIVLYEMLTGKPPYLEESNIETIIAHLTRDIPLLPPQFSCYQELIQRMIAKDPEERFATAGELTSYICGLRAAQQAFAVTVPASSSREEHRQSVDAPPDGNTRARKAVHRGASALAIWRRASLKAKVTLASILAAVVVGGFLLRSEPEMLPQPIAPPVPEQDVRDTTQHDGLWSEAASDVGVRKALTSHAREFSVEGRQTETKPMPVPTPQPQSQQQNEQAAMVEADDAIERESESLAEGEDAPDPASDTTEPTETLQPETVEEPAIAQLLSAAETALADNRLTTPDVDSAYFYYRKTLELMPDNPEALRGLVQIADRYASLARMEISRGNFQRARRYIRRGLSVQPGHSGLRTLKARPSRPKKTRKPIKTTPNDPGGYFLENF